MARRERIAVIGLGTVGCAIGIGLKRAKLSDIEIVGHDIDGDAAARAKRRGAVDATEWNLISTIDGAGLIVLSTPYEGIEATVRAIAAHLAPGAILTDTAIVKAALLETIPALLPESTSFISGNPILRWQDTGPGVREATTDEAIYCLIPSRSARAEAVETVAGFVGALGASPLFMDALEHDAFMAATVQLPELLAAALLSAVSKSPSWREIRRVSGQRLLQAAQTLGTPLGGASELRVNRPAVSRWTDEVIQELRRLEDLAESDPAAWKERLTGLSDLQHRLLARDAEDFGPAAAGERVDIRQEVGRALLGQRLLDATKRMGSRQK